jgi:nucleotide-binding universal stress UspA family protein
MAKPFSILATAVAISPNLEANICESIRLKDKLGSRLYLIHVDKGKPDERAEIVKAVEKAGCSLKDVELVWESGDPIEAILRTCREKKVDLLIAGALQREGIIRYYKGSIARQLVRKSNCSILLMTKPSVTPKPCTRVVVTGINHPKTAFTLEKTIRVSEALNVKSIHIIEEVKPQKELKRADDDEMLQRVTKKTQAVYATEEARINEILAGIEKSSKLTIRHQAIMGRTGYTIGHFTQSIHADLLVLNSPDTQLGFIDRVFTHDLEYILSELPSDILIVHSHG